MSDDISPPGLVIPDATREKFGEMVELICCSESMNMEEKQYWINILPVMNEEQMQSLRDILVSEKEQLQAIDEKYAAGISETVAASTIEEMEKHSQEKRRLRLKQEEQAEAEESTAEDQLLEAINSNG